MSVNRFYVCPEDNGAAVIDGRTGKVVEFVRWFERRADWCGIERGLERARNVAAELNRAAACGAKENKQ